MKFLQSEVEGRERTAMVGSSSSIPRSVTQPVVRRIVEEKKPMAKEASRPSTSALLAETSSGSEKPASSSKWQETKCAFCESVSHKTWECKANTTLEHRLEATRNNGLCFQCLKRGHRAFRCFKARCSKCKARHHLLLCKQVLTKDRLSNSGIGKDTRDTKEVVVTQTIMVAKDAFNTVVVMKVVHAWAEGPKRWRRVQCLLDDGSHRSFVREGLVKVLGLPVIREEYLAVKGFSCLGTMKRRFPVVTLSLRSPHNKMVVCKVDLLVIPEITSAVTYEGKVSTIKEMEDKGLRRAVFDDWSFNQGQIDILFGLDMYWEILTGCNYPLQDGLMASESKFGWVVNGTYGNVDGQSNDGTTVLFTSVEELNSDGWVQECWRLETIGVQHTETNGKHLSDNELMVQQAFEQSTQFKAGRYQVRLPWKEDVMNLRSNWSVARSRLTSLMNGFKGNIDAYQRYHQAMVEYVRNQHVEEVPSCSKTDGLIYYLPHRAVIKEDRKTTKVRIVFDASSHERSAMSLNDCLWTGPNLNPDLLQLLLRFRVHKIALLADIEKAFLQVSLAPEDRDATRFLWIREGWHPGEQPEVYELRMTRVLFGATSSPYLLAATIRHHLKLMENEYPEACQELSRSLYVDDYVSGNNTVEETYKLFQDSRTVMLKASMPLKKWTTNSAELHTKWVEEFPDLKEDLTIQANRTPQKVLGVMWDPVSDTLSLQLKGLQEFVQTSPLTKRTILKGSARIYDPYGFVTPVMIKARCLFQEAWKRKVPWDEMLPPDIGEAWKKICDDWPKLADIWVHRLYISDDVAFGNCELHTFCDASTAAYGSVRYLRVKSSNGIYVSFIASRGRVAPLKTVSLPRMELLGNVIGARLAKYIVTALSLDNLKAYIWTDSTIVLHWLKSVEPIKDIFVKNRVSELHNLFNPMCWRHCPGSDNPADLISRGTSAVKLKDEAKWWNGPTWLCMNEEKWPLCPVQIPDGGVVQDVLQLLVSVKVQPPLLPLEKYSTLWKVLRITAWILRFYGKIRGRLTTIGALSTEELEEARKLWIRHVQQEAFGYEEGNSEAEKRRWGKNLNPFADKDGILRLGTRLQEAKLKEEEKYPILLPADHRFTELLVTKHHVRLLHAGVANTLNDLRENFWIVKGRKIVKKVIRNCLICKRFRLKAAKVIEAPLPKDRVEMTAAFHVTGTDYTGPEFVRENQRVSKAYILIFTCAVTRAVHLELVTDMTTKGFLMAFRRFVARRGICRVLYSDNAKTFQRANRDLVQVWKRLDKNKLQDFFGQQGIEWKFIVERAAWWGGFWERLIQSVKAILKRVLGRSSLSFVELVTVLTEVEAVLNSRPLTPIYDLPEDPQALTPSHFLVGKRLMSLPEKTVLVQGTDATSLRRRWNYCQNLLGHFWNRWLKDYLLQLRTAHQRRNAGQEFIPKVGDVVIVSDHNTPKHLWPCGLVKETILGRDKKVRSCVLKMKTSGSCIRRPIQLLYPLELM